LRKKCHKKASRKTMGGCCSPEARILPTRRQRDRGELVGVSDLRTESAKSEHKETIFRLIDEL